MFVVNCEIATGRDGELTICIAVVKAYLNYMQLL